MPTGSPEDWSVDILRVVNAATSPTDLADALGGSADPIAGIAVARTLLEQREVTGAFRDLVEVREVVDRHGLFRFDDVALALASLAPHVGARVVGLVDPDSTFTELRRVDGGAVRGRRVDLELDRGKQTAQHVSYDDFVVELGLPGPAGFLGWMSEALGDNGIRRSGEVHFTDGRFRPRLVREFTSAVMTSLTFPGCHGSSKDPAAIIARFQPDAVRQRLINKEPLTVSKSASVWQASNYRVTVDGLPSNRVSGVESFSWTRRTADDGSGVVELPDITLTILMEDFQPWYDWLQAVAKGDETLTKGGTISYLAPDLKEELGRVELAGLLPNALMLDSSAANQEQIARFTIELSCLGLQFESDAKL